MPTPRQHILIVEDDPEVQFALKHLFTKQGYEVSIATNGVEAVELLDPKAPPAAVLVDLLMPGVVGHSLLEYLRSEPGFANVRIAIISGSPHLAPPGYPVFAKPLDAHALVEFVRSGGVSPAPPPAA